MKRTARLVLRHLKLVAGGLRRHLLKMPAEAIGPLKIAATKPDSG